MRSFVLTAENRQGSGTELSQKGLIKPYNTDHNVHYTQQYVRVGLNEKHIDDTSFLIL